MAASSAALIQRRVEEQVLRALEEKEARLDAALEAAAAAEASGAANRDVDDEDLEELRARRRRQLQKQHLLREKMKEKGHGELQELHSEKDFFQAAKESNKLIAHFFRPSNRVCELVDARLIDLAHRHIDIRCVKINAEKSAFLCERLKIWCLPTLVLVQDGKTEHSIVGLDELGGELLHG
ncbi:YALI0A00781p, related [Neospora caninum Liverpool]|uniref:YALI0A00781p, related n=1 Tax=Neospora caninum (strain Liverpool) TaxID=572307 RepID=F0VPJ8_NEOCL|nr:YALI0A00781p, related [Neospora caninum Liverpool]CBZ55644.1 YALI0A00781p, related [Neospora caninum Liverpool]|eukprot:XP_003885672.1 YALI0A00781p, related [Neospora caninum Liverpool]